MPTKPVFDPDQIDPERRANAIHVGEQFSSSDTIAQADRTLQAAERYAAAIREFGYIDEDAEELGSYREALEQAGADRTDARAERKQTSAAARAAMKQGKQARQRAQAVLERVKTRLGGNDVARAIAATLAETRSAGSHAVALADQLGALKKLLEQKEVAAAAKSRGGADAVAALSSGIAALSEARAARTTGLGRTGTPEQTAHMDLLDGLIVENVRAARRAGRAAADILGRPEIARAFELTELYGLRPERRDDEPEPAPSPSPSAPNPPAADLAAPKDK